MERDIKMRLIFRVEIITSSLFKFNTYLFHQSAVQSTRIVGLFVNFYRASAQRCWRAILI